MKIVDFDRAMNQAPPTIRHYLREAEEFGISDERSRMLFALACAIDASGVVAAGALQEIAAAIDRVPVDR